MAIDANVLLKGIVPDTTKAAAAGFKLGQDIRNAPLLREQKEQVIAQNEQKLATGEIDVDTAKEVQGLQSIFQGASDLESIIGKGDLAGAENYLNTRIEEGTVAGKDMSDTINARDGLLNDIQSGMTAEQIQSKQLGELKSDKASIVERLDLLSGKLTGAQSKSPKARGFIGTPDVVKQDGELFYSGVFENADGSTENRIIPFKEGSEIVSRSSGESSKEKRILDRDIKLDTEEKIVDIKNSGAAEGEKQKKLGVQRQKIATTINDGARQSRGSRSNLLRLKRALDAVSTGKIAQGRDLMGSIVPGMKDADAEVFNSLATQYVLDELSRQSGTKTDFDFQKAAETQATLGNSKEANEAILTIALDRIDEIEDEERQFKKFVKGGGNEEDFQFKPVPLEFIQLIRSQPDDKDLQKDFKAKYGFLPSGL